MPNYANDMTCGKAIKMTYTESRQPGNPRVEFKLKLYLLKSCQTSSWMILKTALS